MARNRATINITGMNRDMAKGAFDPKFTFENMNIRITARDEACTSFAVTNERGSRLMTIASGTPVGVFTCDKYFGIFSFDSGGDHITVYELKDGEAQVYFHWRGAGLGFSECDRDRRRIETEVSVEAGNSTRVYWVDGVHQPRVMDFMRLREKYGVECDDTNSVTADYFGFLPVVRGIRDFSVQKGTSGHYYSGTVQFAITEVVNGNESNIAYYSPLYYASDDANERGFKPDNDTVGCSFKVSFSCADYGLVDYFIVYAIHRATQDGAAMVTRTEVATGESGVATMTGLEEAVDSSHLLFMNRQAMTGAKTIVQKDGVLFIGSWNGDENDKEKYADGVTVSCVGGLNGRRVSAGVLSGNIADVGYQLDGNSFEIGHFKSSEGYALGYQVMDKYGRWGQPKLIRNGDSLLHEMTVKPQCLGNAAFLPYFEAEVNIDSESAVSVRPVIAYLDNSQKPVLYQGVVTPSIYCEKERTEGTCYAKLSPFARPFRNWGDFTPSKLWANPRDIITEQDRQSLYGDVYNHTKTDGVRSRDGFAPTAKDAGVTEKASMQYGTYPAAQHLQALGTTKDYNNELQTSWRYRDVVFRTALLPCSENKTTSSSSAGNSIMQYSVSISMQVIIKNSSDESSEFFYWTEKFFVGKAKSGKYVIKSYSREDAIDEAVAIRLMSDSMEASNAMYYYLWGDYSKEDWYGNLPQGVLQELKQDSEGVSYWASKTLKSYITITDLSGFAFDAQGVYDGGSFMSSSYASSTISAKKEQYESSMQSRLKDTFGNYDITSSNEGAVDGDTSDVFTIDNTAYFVDASFISLHSPDISSDVSMSLSNGDIRIVGAARMDGFVSDTSIVANTAKLGEHLEGSPGFQGLRPASQESGRCAMSLPNWNSTWDDDMVQERAQLWAVPPFGVNDFLAPENDVKKVENRKDGLLTYHQIANYRFCDSTEYYSSPESIKCSGIETADGKEVGMRVVGGDYVYKPAEDTSIIPSLAFFWSNGPYYTSDGNSQKVYQVGKFKNWQAGNIWQQLLYACQWLKSKDLQQCLDINMVTLITQMSVRKEQWNRGYWHNGGTVDNAELKCGETDLTGGEQGYDQEFFVEGKMNTFNGKDIVLDSYHIDSKLGGGKKGDGAWDRDDDPVTYTISLNYRSTPHAAINLNAPLWNYSQLVSYAVNSDRVKGMYGSKGWKQGNAIQQYSKALISDWRNNVQLPSRLTPDDDCLWVVDIVNNAGEPKVNPATAQWVIAGEAVAVKDGKAKMKWVQGDWYFQRYDCLRTYPQSVTEKSQVVEIVSFMCETRRNLCGRYDSHGGKAFLQANPSNYGLVNDSYTQLNNFFSYSMAGENDNVDTSYPCSIAWSLPKTKNANVDAWTSITGASVLDMDGDKGAVTHLTRLGNSLFCFQPSGIAMVMYNERTPLATDGGTPVELAMSGKVDGKMYIANTAGAVNNINIVTTDRAIYFMDAYNRQLCMLTGEGASSLSEERGFHSWAASLASPALMRLHRDARNSCVMITDDEQALVFSEKLGQFESFMSYDGTYEAVNVQDMTILLHQDLRYRWGLHEMNGGEYNYFFGKYRDYWIDMLIGGGGTDKIFDNVEFRGDLLDDSEEAEGGDKLQPKRCPFNTIRAYNEYQDSGEQPLSFNQYGLSALKNRFRSWFAHIPRNAERKEGRIMERMRNPWCHIVLKMDIYNEKTRESRAQIQDINIDFTE